MERVPSVDSDITRNSCKSGVGEDSESGAEIAKKWGGLGWALKMTARVEVGGLQF